MHRRSWAFLLAGASSQCHRATSSAALSGFPSEPVKQNDRGHQQETISVEARSLSGFSGSPVFVWSLHQLERTAEGVPTAGVVLSPPCFWLASTTDNPWREDVRHRKDKGKKDPDLFIEGNSGMVLVSRSEAA